MPALPAIIKTAAGDCGGFFVAAIRPWERKWRAPLSHEARHRHKNKKAGMIRPFAIRHHISASTSVVKGKGGTAARLIMKG